MTGPGLPEPVTWQIAPDLAEVPAARHRVVQIAQSWRLLDDDTLADVEVCASELLANAVVHTGAAATVSVVWTGTRLRVEVIDTSLKHPAYGNAADPDTCGRGLLLVRALSWGWGWEPHRVGKVVWCEFGIRPASEPGCHLAEVTNTQVPKCGTVG